MPIILSTPYLDRLCEARDYGGLVWIAGILEGSRRFARDEPTYGLPDAAFEIVECLKWFAQGVRSGAWTYFEATSSATQHAMLTSLRRHEAGGEFSDWYDFGMRHWRNPAGMTSLDMWLDTNDALNNTLIRGSSTKIAASFKASSTRTDDESRRKLVIGSEPSELPSVAAQPGGTTSI